MIGILHRLNQHGQIYLTGLTHTKKVLKGKTNLNIFVEMNKILN